MYRRSPEDAARLKRKQSEFQKLSFAEKAKWWLISIAVLVVGWVVLTGIIGFLGIGPWLTEHFPEGLRDRRR